MRRVYGSKGKNCSNRKGLLGGLYLLAGIAMVLLLGIFVVDALRTLYRTGSMGWDSIGGLLLFAFVAAYLIFIGLASPRP